MIQFGGRHLAKRRRQSLVERQGAAGQPHSLLLAKQCASQAQGSVGGDASTGVILNVRQLLAPAFVLALFGDIRVWLYAVFGTCVSNCSVLHYSLWEYE